MKLLRKIALLDDETVKSNIANNNAGANLEELSNAAHQFHFAYSPVLRIQKAWRSYKDNKFTTISKITPEPDFQSLHFSVSPENKLIHQQNVENNNFQICHEMSNDYSGKNINKNIKKSSFFSNKLQDSDPAIPEYSDIEHTTNTYSINEQDLELNNLCPPISLQKGQGEDEEDFQKRVRKVNLLSLAQEFAALKKMNSDALPFDLHQDKYKQACSVSDTASEAGDLSHETRNEQKSNRISLVDISNGNSMISKYQDSQFSCCSVPDIVRFGTKDVEAGKIEVNQPPLGKRNEDGDVTIITINDEHENRVENENTFVDWKSQIISGHGCSKGWVGNREEIRKKLAFYEDDDLESEENLSGLCFVNEVTNDLENVKNKMDTPSIRPDIIPPTIAPQSRENASGMNDNEDFFTKQARLQTEAKMALAQVRPMAHMQLQLEKQKVTKSPLADIVGMPGYGDGMLRKFTPFIMSRMNVAQLQVVVNDLHARIESLNDELMQQLVARDDLHMAQDAMLVDIEDLTGRAKEFAMRVNKRRESNKYI